jgi:hypothetical protein
MPADLASSIAALRSTFASFSDKYEAHRRASRILQDMAAAPAILTSVLERHLARPDALSRGNYPVVSLHIDANAHFELVANCWIALPNGETNLSTKAIHHHGDMILTTVTALGPGYEHWQFSAPEPAGEANELFAMRLLERAPHPLGHSAFVDANIGHVPFFPPAFTVTYALWSTRKPTSWKDSLKRMPALHKHSSVLRRVATSVGMTKMLDLKIVRYFDFFPAPDGFRGMKDRVEFELGPNADYLHSLIHVLQQTNSESLIPALRARLDAEPAEERQLASDLLDRVERGESVSGRLSPGHYDVPHANFKAEDVMTALAACRATQARAAATA